MAGTLSKSRARVVTGNYTERIEDSNGSFEQGGGPWGAEPCGTPSSNTASTCCPFSATSSLSTAATFSSTRSLTIPAASGHAARSGEGLRVQPKGRRSSVVLKPLDEAELAIYELLGACADDPVRGTAPAFDGVCEVDGQRFLQLENLTDGCQDAVVMDVKLGVRTFQERELSSSKPRPDLFEKALQLFPERLDASERTARSMTKARFMMLRDATTTIGSLGFRIDGVSNYPWQDKALVDARIRNAATEGDCEELFLGFAMASAGYDELDASHIAQGVLARLLELRRDLEASEFVKRHEFVGSSLLFVGGAEPRVSWIDFAKTAPVPQGFEVSHRDAWTAGNHEDGLLFGIDSLVEAWVRVAARLRLPEAAAAQSDDEELLELEWEGEMTSPSERKADLTLSLGANVLVPDAEGEDDATTEIFLDDAVVPRTRGEDLAFGSSRSGRTWPCRALRSRDAAQHRSWPLEQTWTTRPQPADLLVDDARGGTEGWPIPCF